MTAFLFTDIEASTDLWERFPAAMHDAHARQRTIIATAVASHEGRVVKDTGDGVFAVFDDPSPALIAAIDSQRELLAATWPDVGVLRVRIGLHFGHADVDADGDLHGPAVNRAARVMDAGHGGQIVASEAFRSALPGGDQADMISLGRHHLKGIAEPIELFQVDAAGLPGEFPPLRTLEGLPNNLPLSLSRFIGRAEETKRLSEMLTEERLVTIVGAGGAGKTRLAVNVGSEMLSLFPDGVWFVDLAGVGEPELVAPTVATALRIPDQPGRSWIESVTRYVHSRALLLIMDNCEHLLDSAASVIDQTLAAGPSCRVLATSREPLNLAGEWTWPITTLSTPAEGSDSADIAASESVAMFIDRAGAIRPDFDPSPEDLGRIVDICRRLDGLPLAIELAAARVRALPVADIAGRLDDRFRLLVGGNRTALARQRTLEATVAWSYQLLDAPMQALFDSLSVFAGPFTLDAAERLCRDADLDVLNGVLDLVDKSLLERVDGLDGAGRFRMLETLRMFGRDRLIDRGVAHEVRNQLLGWAVELTSDMTTGLMGSDQLRRLRVLDAEIDNLRAAMQWSVDQRLWAQGAAIAGSMQRYWFDRSAREGQAWLDRLLSGSAGEGSTGEAIEVPVEIEAQARTALGHMLQVMGNDSAAIGHLRRAAELFATVGNLSGRGWALHYAGRTLWGLDDHDASLAAMTESVREFERVGDEFGAYMSAAFVLHIQAVTGNPEAALAHVDDFARRGAEVGLSPSLSSHMAEYAFIYHALAGHPEDGADRLHQAMQGYSVMGDHPCVAHALETTAFYASCSGRADVAVALHGAALQLWDDAGVVVPPWERMLTEPVNEFCRGLWSEEELATRLAEGAALGTRQAVALAIEITGLADR